MIETPAEIIAHHASTDAAEAVTFHVKMTEKALNEMRDIMAERDRLREALEAIKAEGYHFGYNVASSGMTHAYACQRMAEIASAALKQEGM